MNSTNYRTNKRISCNRMTILMNFNHTGKTIYVTLREMTYKGVRYYISWLKKIKFALYMFLKYRLTIMYKLSNRASPVPPSP